MTEYRTFRLNKLVRDKIIDMTLEYGGKVTAKKLNGKDFNHALIQKLIEEAQELQQSEVALGELADLQEIINQLAKNIGIFTSDLKAVQKKKINKTGGFENGDFIETLSAPADNEWADYYGSDPIRFPEIAPNVEMIDVLDENGEKTGQALPLTEVHEKELWHGVAHVWVYNQGGQILLHRRHPDLSWGAGKWDLAGGGHISAQENPKDAALRELEEEMGLTADKNQIQLIGITVSINKTQTTGKSHKVYEWNYIVQMDVDLKDVRLQEDEATEAAWFDLDKFEADIKSDETSQQYTPRDESLYNLVITFIRKKIN